MSPRYYLIVNDDIGTHIIMSSAATLRVGGFCGITFSYIRPTDAAAELCAACVKYGESIRNARQTMRVARHFAGRKRMRGSPTLAAKSRKRASVRR